MNTATRMMHSQTISLQKWNNLSLSGSGLWIILLSLALFFSAFGIVYAKDLNRRLLIREQILEKENIIASERWGKLLLEQSTLARQSRIYRLATSRLGMVVPASSQLVASSNPKDIEVDREALIQEATNG